MKRTKLPFCGNPRCCASTGIHEGITFGWGELDDLGYWEFPCLVCAAAHDERMKTERADIIAKLKTQGKTDEEIRRDHEWLFIPAWPRRLP